MSDLADRTVRGRYEIGKQNSIWAEHRDSALPLVQPVSLTSSPWVELFLRARWTEDLFDLIAVLSSLLLEVCLSKPGVTGFVVFRACRPVVCRAAPALT